MVQLTWTHYIYVIIILIIIAAIILKRDVALICILGIGIIGFMATGSLLKAVGVIYKAITVSGKEFIDIIIIISLVNAMSKALSDIGADEIMISPIKRLMLNKTMAFFILGITMMIISWFIWPTAAVVFIGAIMVPAAIKVGLPRIWIAVALCLFGKGAALSSDFFIQGAPATTARSAGINDTFEIVKASIPFWSTMCIASSITAFILMKLNTRVSLVDEAGETAVTEDKRVKGSKTISVLTIGMFILNILFMILFKIKGEEATALIGGTAVLILIFAVIAKFGLIEALGEFTGYIRNGFMFGTKIFAPIIVIGAFFFLGSEDTANRILGSEASGLLTDVSMYVSSKVRLSRISAITMQGIISIMVGVSGSGFGGIPLVGTLARAFSTSIDVSIEKIAAFGQVITVWIGGGTIIPWSVVPVAAICEVTPIELAKKNLIPVAVGVAVTFIVGLIWI
ncbi:TRAP transporter large permease subunit [Clostridium bovifaecis]|uniref:TRAP transporter large permease subunit n=1 Tax=Clostridium bovifaecis TaxID=2184719 RepID=A0A6I6F778_9CLOT|nr:TRAP transporter large permease subunit [Clostridium bovifaecis]